MNTAKLHPLRPAETLPPPSLWRQLRWVVVVLSFFFLGIDWLALDDVTSGTEPHLLAEWTLVALSVIWFGGIVLALSIAASWRRRIPK